MINFFSNRIHLKPISYPYTPREREIRIRMFARKFDNPCNVSERRVRTKKEAFRENETEGRV